MQRQIKQFLAYLICTLCFLINTAVAQSPLFTVQKNRIFSVEQITEGGIKTRLFVFFARYDLFFRDITASPEEIFGHTLPEYVETEQSFKSEEGYIFVGIDRKEKLRIHFVKATTPQNTNIGVKQLLRIAKKYRVAGGDKPGFLVRYLAAHIDPRRVKVQKEIPIQYNDGSTKLLLLTAQSDKWFAVLYLRHEGVLLVATHPKEPIDSHSAMNSFQHFIPISVYIDG